MKPLASHSATDPGLAPDSGSGSLCHGNTFADERPPLVLTFDVEDWH
jgi:hypothetical protein